ncbi:MAG: hypothetical protein LJE94_02935 [Deltaproteobacteria bacterium]|nr:hypothetical protein [Deltaproteobacteria bacterium]
MIYHLEYDEIINDRLDCIGEFNSEDDICRKHCALRLRCAIEHSQKARQELIEDIVASNSTFIKFQ